MGTCEFMFTMLPKVMMTSYMKKNDFTCIPYVFPDTYLSSIEAVSYTHLRNYQNRTIGLIENGSWAPNAAKVMKAEFEKDVYKRQPPVPNVEQNRLKVEVSFSFKGCKKITKILALTP